MTHYEKIIKTFPCDKVLGNLYKFGHIGFREFCDLPEIMKIISSETFTNPELSTMIHILYEVYLMKVSGEKIFHVEQDLALQLMNTEVRGIKGEMLKTPYVCQYFHTPYGLLQIYNEETGNHNLEGLYVSKLGNELRAIAIGTANENSINEFDDAVSYYKYIINNDEDLSKQVDQQIKDSKKDPETKKAGGLVNIDKAKKLFNFILNLLLYITSANADIKKQTWNEVDPKLKKMSGKKRAERLKSLKRNFILINRLGSSFRLNREQRNMYKTFSKLKTLVMGFYRNQWFGPKANQHQKLIWIKPFWRNKDSDQTSNLPHKVV